MKQQYAGSLNEQVQTWAQAACDQLFFTPQALERRPLPPVHFARRIEHTLLRLDAQDQDVRRLCKEAIAHKFRSVCCLPRDVVECRRLLTGFDILVVTVINFPLSSARTKLCALESQQAVADGADELDYVLDVRALRSGKLEKVRDGVLNVVEAGGVPVKAILETGLLTAEEMAHGAIAAEAGGACFVKTSTGFGPRGAEPLDVEVLRLAVQNRLGIKASGGIHTRESADRLVLAGADLIGTSHGPKLVS
jgi:deoxyribose-phosphate aldolase